MIGSGLRMISAQVRIISLQRYYCYINNNGKNDSM